MVNINFPGGGGLGNSTASNFTTTGHYAAQGGVGFPNGNLSLEGNYPIRVDDINVNQIGGSVSVRLRFGGTDYAIGDIIYTDGNNGNCSIRIYKTGSSTATFNRTTSTATPKVTEYTSTGAFYYEWGGQMTGNWDYTTVPLPPSSISTTLSGTDVIVTRGTSADATGYRIQYQVSTDGATYGSWGNTTVASSTTTTFSNLEKGKFYRFRVYAINAAGNGAATTASTSTFVPGFGYRFISTTQTTPIASVKVFIGIGQPGADASGWKLVSNVKRYVSDAGNGSPGWINLQS